MMQNANLSRLMIAATAMLFLSACEMTSPSRVSTSPIEVHADRASQTIPFKEFNEQNATAIANDYKRYGDGPVHVLVTYPAGMLETQSIAEQNRVMRLIKAAGVTDVTGETLPVVDVQYTNVHVDYTRITASGPAGCDPHPGETRNGLAGSEDGQFPDYRFGCGVDTYIAGQVSRPKELLGTDEMDASSGERSGAAAKDYRDGKPYKDLNAKNASETNL